MLFEDPLAKLGLLIGVMIIVLILAPGIWDWLKGQRRQ